VHRASGATVLAVAWQVRHFSEGLKAYVVPKEWVGTKDPLTWHRLSISADQGGDALAGIAYLQRELRLCLDFCPDPSHGCNNDFWVAAKGAQMNAFFHLLLLVLNVPLGPWAEDLRFSQVNQGMRELLALEDPESCPLFQEYVAAISSEMGLEMSATGDQDRYVWEQLKTSSVLSKKGAKVVKARFLGVLRRGGVLTTEWSLRLFAYTALCLHMQLDFSSVAPLKVRAAAGVGAQGSTSARVERPEESALRLAGGNQVLLAATFLRAEANTQLLRAVCEVADPLQQWHGRQNIALVAARCSG
jgi:hypothetical protein